MVKETIKEQKYNLVFVTTSDNKYFIDIDETISKDKSQLLKKFKTEKSMDGNMKYKVLLENMNKYGDDSINIQIINAKLNIKDIMTVAGNLVADLLSNGISMNDIMNSL